jgi:hypothetical protein
LHDTIEYTGDVEIFTCLPIELECFVEVDTGVVRHAAIVEHTSAPYVVQNQYFHEIGFDQMGLVVQVQCLIVLYGLCPEYEQQTLFADMIDNQLFELQLVACLLLIGSHRSAVKYLNCTLDLKADIDQVG